MTELYTDHHGWLVHWLRRKLGCRDSAADLAQDTFVRILTSRDLTGLRAPRAYLATVANGLVANHWRHQAIERAYLEILAQQEASLAPSPEERAIVLETLIEIDRMLDGLSAKARKAFLLAQLDGLTYAEIAGELGVSVSMVKKYMLQATQQCYFSLSF